MTLPGYPFDSFVKLAMRHTYKCCFCGRFLKNRDINDGRKTKWVYYEDVEWDNNTEMYMPYDYSLPSHIRCYNKAMKDREQL